MNQTKEHIEQVGKSYCQRKGELKKVEKNCQNAFQRKKNRWSDPYNTTWVSFISCRFLKQKRFTVSSTDEPILRTFR